MAMRRRAVLVAAGPLAATILGWVLAVLAAAAVLLLPIVTTVVAVALRPVAISSSKLAHR